MSTPPASSRSLHLFRLQPVGKFYRKHLNGFERSLTRFIKPNALKLLIGVRRLVLRGTVDMAPSSKISGRAPLDLATRRQLLLEHIFWRRHRRGCLPTYGVQSLLALLSDLNPRDLAVLRNGGHKLPALRRNIRRGAEGDFFGVDSDTRQTSG